MNRPYYGFSPVVTRGDGFAFTVLRDGEQYTFNEVRPKVHGPAKKGTVQQKALRRLRDRRQQ